MQSTKKLSRTLGVVLFCAGVLAGMVMFILMNWAYFEASFYFGNGAPANGILTNLRCPLVMTTSDMGKVSMSVTNNTSNDLSIPVQIELSYYGAATLDKTDYPVAAGATRNISWKVTSDNLVFGHLVMARVYQFRSYTLPSRTNTCGTVMVALPGVTGMQVFIIMLVFSLVAMVAGWWLWLAGSRPLQHEGIIATRAMVLMTIICVFGILGGILGWWGLGLICAAGGLLLIISVAGHYIYKT
jgi:hypothetical protein